MGLMAGYFILILGMLALALHVPGLVVPVSHRRLGLRFVQSPSNLRLIGLAMVAIGVGAVLVSPNDGVTGWGLPLVGAYQILSGLFLLGFPGKFRSRMEAIFSGPLKLWIGRAVVKCVVALALLVWGLMLILG
ncbi:MAG: hypothetical protein V3T70_02615 [Phycisphaerae bacterium]